MYLPTRHPVQGVKYCDTMSLQVKSKLSQEAEKDGGGRLKAIIDTVIGNLQTSITHVHIRYEVSASTAGS